MNKTHFCFILFFILIENQPKQFSLQFILFGRKLPILNSVKLLLGFQMLPFNQILEVIFVVSNHRFCFCISLSAACGRWEETSLCPTQQTCCLFFNVYSSTVTEKTDICGK